MDCPVPSAVVPVGGLGTRLLPATRALPKGLLPVGRKPAVQRIAEELVRNGVRRALFVTGRGQVSVQRHLEPDPDPGGPGLRVSFVQQGTPRGLGDAVLHAEGFAGGEPFLVALGDTILGLPGQSMACRLLATVFAERNADVVVALESVPEDRTGLYGIVQPVRGGRGRVVPIDGIVEKPVPAEAPSRLAVAGRYVFSPEIFDSLRRVPPDSGGEVQLTDAIRTVMDGGGTVLGVRLGPRDRRFDIGNLPGYFEAFLEFALHDPDHGSRVAESMGHLLGGRRSGPRRL